MKTKDPMLRYIFLSVFALLLLTACGGNDLEQLKNSRQCVECDLSGSNLTGFYLAGAILTRAILAYAKLQRANLTGVIGADFRDAKNVPAKYLKD